MVRCDHGQTVAAQAARMAVAPIERAGGQAQYIRREIPSASSSLTPLLEWAVCNADRPLTLADLAARANASPRTLERRFRAQTGFSPLQWLLAVRLARARELLETTALQVEEVAAKCGFPTAAALREHFRRNLGVTPTAYRRAFGGG
jgi:transcriptional regulator GlxA family with amidase domain